MIDRLRGCCQSINTFDYYNFTSFLLVPGTLAHRILRSSTSRWTWKKDDDSNCRDAKENNQFVLYTEKPQPQKPKTELPQPKPKEKPTSTPQPEIKRDTEVYNDLKNKITSKIKSLVDSKKGTVDVYGMYQFGEEVSNEINKILLTVDETKNFKVELIKETDNDYLKPGLKTTLKGLKNLLVIPDVKNKQKVSYEQPKQNNLPSNF